MLTSKIILQHVAPPTDRHDDAPRPVPIRGAAVVAARLATAWMVTFAVVHVYWLLDGRIGLPRRESIYERPALVVIDAIAVPLCLAGAALAHSLTWPPRRWPRPRTRLRAIGATAAVLVVHALPTVPTWVRLLAGDEVALTDDERYIAFLYEPVFMSGGLLCAAAYVGFRATGVRVRARTRTNGPTA